MRLRYDHELDEALAWSGWFCRVTGQFLNRDAIEIGRRYWAEWQRIVDEDRRALLVEGDGEDLLADYRFWRDADAEFTIAVIRSRGLASPEALGCLAAGRAARRRPGNHNSGKFSVRGSEKRSHFRRTPAEPVIKSREQ
jgi:hypothetical protein